MGRFQPLLCCILLYIQMLFVASCDWGNSDRTETTFNDGSTEFSILVNSILDDFESQVPDRSNQPCEIDIPTLPANDNEPARPESLADILRQISEDIDVNKNNHFNIYREDIFGCCVRAMNRKSFSPHYKISVKFSDIEGNSEGAVDEGGPRREMFRLVLQWIKESSLFCGQDKKHVTLSGKGLQEKQYFEAGRLIALSLIHGGPAPHFFSDSLFAILTGDECVPTVDDMPDEIKIQLLKFQECKELIELQNVMLDTDIFTIAGFPFVISFYDKEKILEGTLKFYGTNRVGAAIDQLIDGLKICNLHHHIVNFPQLFKEAFCSFPAKLTAELLENIFSISYSEAGSNRRNVENRVISFFRDYVLECEEESGTTSLEDILIFATGADCVPPLGFTTKPQLLFLNDSTSRFPTANTCALQLNLPTVHASYEDFKDNMNFAINNCKEFGFA